jgi:type II secretory ATPase GspE/PulE/Tfp pilus assembly ATPase PilB-like protein
MTCEEVRDELIAYARGELDADRKAEVEEHLARCSGCTRELEGSLRVLALTQMADDVSIADLAKSLVEKALQRGASDLHLEMAARGEPRTRLRIGGVLHEGPSLTRQQHEPLVAHIKMMAGMNVTEKRVPQDGRIALSLEGKDYDLRVSTVPFLDGEGVVMRILDRSTVLIGLNKLGLYPRTLAQLETLIAQRDGLILTTGPTGAGKSTLLYSVLNRLNRPEVKILSVEDPVEYRLPGVNQLAVHRRSGVTFAAAMRAFMRQDPDIFMVGEMRDLETAEMCVQAALTGHLVLSALHTRDATGALTRLMDMGVEPFLVAATVIGVIGQRLVRRVCPGCQAAYEPSEETLAALGFTADRRPARFLHGTGCDACGATGYRGRIGLFELLTMSEELAHLVVARTPEASLRQRALEMDALWPFLADARAKIADGITTAEEVDRVLLGLHAAGKG